MRGPLTLVAFAAAVLVPAAALAVGVGSGKVETTLTGAAEVPKRGPAAGRGKAELTIRGRRVCWEIKVSGIGTPVAAHVHKGRAGKAGPVVVPFGKGFKREGCTSTSLATANAILRTPAAYYVNVHTKRFPAGAVRGQLRSGDGGSRY